VRWPWEAVLPFAFDPTELAIPSVEGTSEVALFVASRCKNLLLFLRQHPVWFYLGIQVDVHFIAVDHDLLLR